MEISEYLLKQLDVEGEKIEDSSDSDTTMYSTDLRETTNRYLETEDVGIYTQAVFRHEVFDKMTSEQKIRLIFELKEKGLAEMEEAWKPSIETFELGPLEENVPHSRQKRMLNNIKQNKIGFGQGFDSKHLVERGSPEHEILQRGSAQEIQTLIENRRNTGKDWKSSRNTFIVVDSKAAFVKELENPNYLNPKDPIQEVQYGTFSKLTL